jgi:lysophospholipase L1-like esterase
MHSWIEAEMKSARTKTAAIVIVLVIAATSLIFLYNNSTQKASAQPIRVACVGDSITEWSHYTDDLQDMLGDGYLVENFGVAGSAVLKNSDKPYMNQAAFQQAMDFQPSVVIIMLGTNDAKDTNYRYITNFPNDYEQLINECNSVPDVQHIWLVKPPPIYSNTLGLNGVHLDQGIIPEIEQVATNLNLPTIDVNQALTNHSDYFIDGVHPNSDGAQLIANTIDDALLTQMIP